MERRNQAGAFLWRFSYTTGSERGSRSTSCHSAVGALRGGTSQTACHKTTTLRTYLRFGTGSLIGHATFSHLFYLLQMATVHLTLVLSCAINGENSRALDSPSRRFMGCNHYWRRAAFSLFLSLLTFMVARKRAHCMRTARSAATWRLFGAKQVREIRHIGYCFSGARAACCAHLQNCLFWLALANKLTRRRWLCRMLSHLLFTALPPGKTSIQRPSSRRTLR